MIDHIRTAAHKAGGLSKLAATLGVNYRTFHGWKRVPSRHCVKFSEVSGISLHELRPDIYPNNFENPKQEAA